MTVAAIPITNRTAVIASIAVLVLAGCGTSGSQTRPTAHSTTGSTGAEAWQAARFAKLAFPADAHSFQVYSEYGIDQLMLLRFRIKRTNRQQFLRGSGLPQPTPGLSPIQPNLGDNLGWRLDELSRFEGTRNEADPVRQIPVRQVVIDTADPTTLTVYVAAFST